ncbi:MAG TPA: DUF2147 domain-containing protein [Gammaproteobacteria bacterium]|nr:DUF2147 domain-containing protein [Gammaproteobacteria bacterium]
MHIKINLFKVLVSIFLISLSTTIFAAENITSTDSPIGYWKTIDDITGKPKSIVQIWRDQNHLLMAKIIKIFPDNQANQNKICVACRGEKHNRPIVGMVIMSGLKSAENQWTSGHILDPENGKTYKCKARLTEKGKRLNVQGYIGLPLFGRSQTWERVDLMSG